jgi:5-(carboxyamino)imidazole ribonucleotide synthase
VIGGGQLARMMAGPAIELGLHLRLLATDPQESAAQVIPDVLLGRHDDPSAVQELARDVDVVTFDHEHVPQEVLATLGDLAPARPGPAALTHAQDKLTMRRRLTELGHPCPRWWEVADAGALDEAIAAAGGRAVVKTPRGGYDGHGVRIVEKAEQVADWCTGHESLLVEELVPFTRELSAQVARTPSGEIATYPVVRSTQKDGVCFEVLAPAPDLDAEAQERIQGLARAIAEDLGVTGMLAVELFELADLPLGSTASHAPYAVMVNLLGGSRVDLAPGVAEALRRDPALKVHLYGKGVRPGRKLGHVTVIGEDPDDLLARAHRAERLIIEGSDSTEGTDSTDGVTNA